MAFTGRRKVNNGVFVAKSFAATKLMIIGSIHVSFSRQSSILAIERFPLFCVCRCGESTLYPKYSKVWLLQHSSEQNSLPRFSASNDIPCSRSFSRKELYLNHSHIIRQKNQQFCFAIHQWCHQRIKQWRHRKIKAIDHIFRRKTLHTWVESFQ